MIDRIEQANRIDVGRTRRVHVGQNRARSHHRIEESKEGKAAEVLPAGFDAVTLRDHVDLGQKSLMAIENTFGWPGATGGEDDGRRVLQLSHRRTKLIRRSGFQFREGRRREKAKASAYRHEELGVGKQTPFGLEDRLRNRNRDKTIRLGFCQAVQKVLATHPRIDQHQGRTGLQKGEDQRDEVLSEFHQQRDAVIRADPHGLQACGDRARALVEIPEADRAIATMGSLTMRADRCGDPQKLWPGGGLGRQSQSDVRIQSRVHNHGSLDSDFDPQGLLGFVRADRKTGLIELRWPKATLGVVGKAVGFGGDTEGILIELIIVVLVVVGRDGPARRGAQERLRFGGIFEFDFPNHWPLVGQIERLFGPCRFRLVEALCVLVEGQAASAG